MMENSWLHGSHRMRRHPRRSTVGARQVEQCTPARCRFSKSHLKTFPPRVKPLARILRNIGTTRHPPFGGLSISPVGFALAAGVDVEFKPTRHEQASFNEKRLVLRAHRVLGVKQGEAESVIGIDASWRPPKAMVAPPIGGIGDSLRDEQTRFRKDPGKTFVNGVMPEGASTMDITAAAPRFEILLPRGQRETTGRFRTTKG
jgi:hypothetical protein